MPERDVKGQTGAMGVVVGLVAFLVALAAVLAAAGHAGYLAMLTAAAQKRPGGQPAVEFARKRLPAAGATLGVTVLALLFSLGSVPLDVIAIVLGGGGGIASIKALQSSQERFRSGRY